MRYAILTAVLTVGATAPALATTEFDVFTSWSRVDLPQADSADGQAAILRIETGRRWRFRATVPVVRLETPLGVAQTSLGPVPLSEEQTARRRRNGNGTPGGGEASDLAAVGDGSEWVSGLGDVKLGVAGRVVGGGARLFRFDAELDVKLPTGDEPEGLGTGEWDSRLGLAAERRFWPLTAFAGAGWNRLGDPAWIDYADVLDAYAGIETEPGRHGLLWSSWLEAENEAVPGAGSRVSLGGGLRGSGRVRWQFSLKVGLTEAAEAVRAVLGVGWSPGPARPRTPLEPGR